MGFLKSNLTDKIILDIRNLSLQFGGLQVLHEVSFKVQEESIFAIIGPNGAGKTSLLNCINGLYKPKRGQIFFRGKDLVKVPCYKIGNLGIARTFQNIEMFKSMTVMDNLLLGYHGHLKSGPLASGFFWGKTFREEMEARRRIEDVIDFLGIEKWRREVVSRVSFGILKRVELGRALVQNPDIILLDEPTAGMNAEETEDMVRFILDVHEEWKGVTFILVEHDMNIVMNIAHRICVLDFGRKLAEGDPEEIQNNRKVQKAYLGE